MTALTKTQRFLVDDGWDRTYHRTIEAAHKRAKTLSKKSFVRKVVVTSAQSGVILDVFENGASTYYQF